MNHKEFSKVCRALSDPNRLGIIQMISDQEKCACKLLEHFAISQPTLSHHMKILEDAALVILRRDGKWTHYSMNTETLREFGEYWTALRIQAEAAAMAGPDGNEGACGVSCR
jgi:ArsR family transcriptional regulator